MKILFSALVLVLASQWVDAKELYLLVLDDIEESSDDFIVMAKKKHEYI